MIQKISRKKFLLNYPEFPQLNYKTDDFTYPEVYDNYILTLSSKSARGHAIMLGVELANLNKSLKNEDLFFLAEMPRPWLSHYNDYKPVKAASDYLVNNGISKSFNGAIKVGLSDLPEFVKHFFWLVRCNASLPYFHFCNKDFNITGNICQYGNVHLAVLNEEIDKAVENAIPETKFEALNGNTCYDTFSKSRAIPGRQIIV